MKHFKSKWMQHFSRKD